MFYKSKFLPTENNFYQNKTVLKSKKSLLTRQSESQAGKLEELSIEDHNSFEIFDISLSPGGLLPLQDPENNNFKHTLKQTLKTVKSSDIQSGLRAYFTFSPQ